MSKEKAKCSEWQALRILSQSLEAEAEALSPVGLQDDCAVLSPEPGEQLVWTTDACLENVHFKLAWMQPEDIAWKALHAAVSDVAAMGAQPWGALCHVTWTPATSESFLQRFAEGQRLAQAAAECAILGGNLACGAEFQVVTTVLGRAPAESGGGGARLLKRGGARVGDELWLVGEIGLAHLGYRLLENEYQGAGAAEARCLQAFRRPQARVREGQALAQRAHACLDVSDGLAGDAAHLARASGVRLVLEAERLLVQWEPAEIQVAKQLGLSPLEALLYGGEDYALLAAGPAGACPEFARVIGRVEAGSGVYLESAGQLQSLAGGFEHGR